jgi:glycerol kinase
MERATNIFVDQGHEISDIKAIGITNQRETTVVWDTNTGEPLYNAIAWPDTRTKGLVRELKLKEGADKLQNLCGLPLSTYPSSVKLVWLIDHVEEVRKAYDEGRLSFGTIDTWILYNLNGGKEKDLHVTDATNASRTMFMNLHTVQYDDTLLEFFGLDRKKLNLPKIVPSSSADAFGSIQKGELKGIRIAGCLGDQSSALVGQQGFTPGAAKNTYGTGCFLLYNVGEKPVISTHGLLATVACVRARRQHRRCRQRRQIPNEQHGLHNAFPQDQRPRRKRRRQRRLCLRHRLLRPLRPVLDRRC